MLLVPLPARGQSAALTGSVTNQRGVAVPAVTVTAQDPVRGTAVSAVSDYTGAYSLTLDPGIYTVVFTMAGIERQRSEGVQLLPGGTQVLDVTLPRAAFAEMVDVVAVTPLRGTGISRDRVPATISVLGARELGARGTPSLADALHERFGSVTLEGTTTNLFQPTLGHRGFNASPLLGLAQGIAVYQNGVRINEPFGDTVQFDLMPQFAVAHVQLNAGANPVFGLNTLGSALILGLKNGFDHQGFSGEIVGGSFGRYATVAQYGASRGPWALFAGASHFEEDGWRVASPSEVTQVFADVGYRTGRVDGGLSVTLADTSLTGNAPAPIELLDVDRSGVFTFPDVTENRLAFVQGRANLAVTANWSMQITGYYRDLDRRTLNGDEAEFDVCDDDVLPAGAPDRTLCFGGDDDDDDDETVVWPVVDVRSGRFITSLDAAGDGALNRTRTRARGYGAALQATTVTDIGTRENVLLVGASADLADVAFASTSEVGMLTPERGVVGSGLRAGLYGRGGDDLFNTDLETANQGFGVYVNDTLSVTDRVHVTAAGRFNLARIDIVDRIGTSLTGDHTFARFNPALGGVYQLGAETAIFAWYSQSNRAPTAVELSCADPEEPCRVPNAFVSDPPLEQAVARSFETGLRGSWQGELGSAAWSVAAYRTRIDDDILFVASPELIGTGYFQNAGKTARIGIDVDLSGQVGRTNWYFGYGLVEATFASTLQLPGDAEVNDAATADGALVVEPGDRLPGIPRHSVKVGVRQGMTDAWSVAGEAVVASSRVYAGDEGNDQMPLAGYGVVNLRSTYGFDAGLELFLRVDNLFDVNYATAGVLAELEVHLREAPDASDPRFIGPGAPRSAFAGLRVAF